VLVDSGNIWRNAISKDFTFNHMKLTVADIRPLSTKTLGTAKDGASMRVLGEVTRPLPLQLGGISTCLKTRQVVVEGLLMPFNLAGPFLKKHKIDQIHLEDCIRFQGHDVKLLKRRKGSYTDVETALSNVYVVKKTVVKLMQHTTVTLRAAEVEQKSMPAGNCVVTGSIKFMDTTNLHPWIDAITKVGEDGWLIAAVMNSTDEEITIQPDTCYGTISLIANSHQAWEEKPWRLCHIQATASSHTLPEATYRVKLRPDGAPTDITERESDVIAAVSGATPKDNKESRQKPPLKDHETWPKEKRRAWMIENFKFSTSPVLNTPQKVDRAVEFLDGYWDLYSIDGSFGKTNLIEHQIYTEDVPPIKTPHRPINPRLEKNLRDQLDKWIEHDVIEPSSSHWSFAMVAAPKKGGAIRWYIDYRLLNKLTLNDSISLPGIEDNLARLSRSSFFSGVDSAGAYHCVWVHKADRPKTAFSTPFGLW
jgi:hypothetical protein